MPESALSIWTVYASPRDYPGYYVARRSEVGDGPGLKMTSDMFVADTLAELRALLPPGLHRIGRSPEDDPIIVEIWL